MENAHSSVGGALDRIRTCDLDLSGDSLYPAELRARWDKVSALVFWGVRQTPPEHAHHRYAMMAQAAISTSLLVIFHF